MIVQTSKGAVSLADATSVTLKPNPAAYIPKLVGLAVIALGIVAVIFGIREINGPGGVIEKNGDGQGWSLFIFAMLAILWAFILGGFSLLRANARNEVGKALWLAIALPVLAALFSMGNGTYAISREGSFHGVALALAFFAFGGLVWWSRSLVGRTDATITYPNQSVTLRGLALVEAARLAASVGASTTTATS